MLFLLTLTLSGNIVLIITIWIATCAAPGFIVGLFTKQLGKIGTLVLEAGTAYIGTIPVFLAGVYLGSLVIIALCYKLGVRNFMRMQFSRWMRVDNKK